MGNGSKEKMSPKILRDIKRQVLRDTIKITQSPCDAVGKR